MLLFDTYLHLYLYVNKLNLFCVLSTNLNFKVPIIIKSDTYGKLQTPLASRTMLSNRNRLTTLLVNSSIVIDVQP